MNSRTVLSSASAALTSVIRRLKTGFCPICANTTSEGHAGKLSVFCNRFSQNSKSWLRLSLNNENDELHAHLI